MRGCTRGGFARGRGGGGVGGRCSNRSAAPGAATEITCAGTVEAFPAPARPISTPTPIASSSTPTPATAVAPEERPPPAAAAAPPPLDAAGPETVAGVKRLQELAARLHLAPPALQAVALIVGKRGAAVSAGFHKLSIIGFCPCGDW